jgi:acetyl-CoA carboxylase carboxyl transferase subunit beta
MTFFKRSKFGGFMGGKNRVPDGVWIKCDSCHEAVYRNEVIENLHVCPACGHHFRIPALERLERLLDRDSFVETHTDIRSADPLEFKVGKETYAERVQRAQESTGLEEALVTGFGTIEGKPGVFGAMDPRFIMASMGSALGERFVRAAADAIRHRLCFVCFAASGGARMQEGILALMQMAKTTDAIREMNEAGVPFISVLTDPTTGGVYASFASLGDVILAEPGANIGFAGKRLIESSLRVKLPEGFQSAEFQMEHGFVDRIVPRGDMRSMLAKLLEYLTPEDAKAPSGPVREVEAD